MCWDLVSSLDNVIKCFVSSLVSWEMGLVVLPVLCLCVYVFCVLMYLPPWACDCHID